MQPLSQNNETANVNNKTKEDYRKESEDVLGEATKNNPNLLISQKVETYEEFRAKNYNHCYEAQKERLPNYPDRIIQRYAERACQAKYYKQKKR